jgi:hypothetical protein
MSHSAELNTGMNTIRINMDKLAAGVYYLHLKAEGIDRHFKLQKL